MRRTFTVGLVGGSKFSLHELSDRIAADIRRMTAWRVNAVSIHPGQSFSWYCRLLAEMNEDSDRAVDVLVTDTVPEEYPFDGLFGAPMDGACSCDLYVMPEWLSVEGCDFGASDIESGDGVEVLRFRDYGNMLNVINWLTWDTSRVGGTKVVVE